MLKVAKVIFSVLVALIVIYGIWMFLVYKPISNIHIPKFVDSTVYTGDSVTVRVEKREENTDQYDIEYFLPKVSGSISPLVSAKINTTISSEVSNIITQFKEDHQGISIDQKDTLSISLSHQSVIYQRYLNIEFVEYSYLAGSAHPLTYTHTYVFDLQTGEKVSLDKIFNTELAYLQKISEIIKEKLTTQISIQSIGRGEELTSTTTDQEIKNILDGIDTEEILKTTFFEEGILPRDENYKEFILREDGIEFVFGQYQVAPYVFGEQRVLIMYPELESILNDSFKKVI